jgi:hypothetical protein
VISQVGYFFLLTNKEPSPSINPLSHSLNRLSSLLKDDARVVSEVPTKYEINFLSRFQEAFI